LISFCFFSWAVTYPGAYLLNRGGTYADADYGYASEAQYYYDGSFMEKFKL
jgi:hypothetical protein